MCDDQSALDTWELISVELHMDCLKCIAPTRKRVARRQSCMHFWRLSPNQRRFTTSRHQKVPSLVVIHSPHHIMPPSLDNIPSTVCGDVWSVELAGFAKKNTQQPIRSARNQTGHSRWPARFYARSLNYYFIACTPIVRRKTAPIIFRQSSFHLTHIAIRVKSDKFHKYDYLGFGMAKVA